MAGICYWHEEYQNKEVESFTECDECGKPICEYCLTSFLNKQLCIRCANTLLQKTRFRLKCQIFVMPIVSLITGLIALSSSNNFLIGFLIGWIICSIPLGWTATKNTFKRSGGIVSFIFRCIYYAVFGSIANLISFPFNIRQFIHLPKESFKVKELDTNNIFE